VPRRGGKSVKTFLEKKLEEKKGRSGIFGSLGYLEQGNRLIENEEKCGEKMR